MQPNTTVLDAARQVVAILETSGYLDGDSADALRLITAVQRVDLADIHREREQLAAERDRLAAELDALRSAPPALPASLAQAAPELTTANTPAKRRFRAKEESASDVLTCPEPTCDRTFKNAKALGAHRARAHGWKKDERVTPAPSPKRTGIRLVDDGPIPFRCEVCHRDTFARDLHQPNRCVRCARGAA